MFARAIWAASHRKDGPFEAINCAAIPKDLLESELFGHVKGAFSGAVKDRVGAFERTNRGTLFLDEIGECDPLLQTKLLRVLQPPPGGGPCYREFYAVGATKLTTCDVRIIAATNRDLHKEIKANRFREDLFYRLAVITLGLPPLRERKRDIPLLVADLLKKINQDFSQQQPGTTKSEPGYKHKSISDSAMDFVKRHDWPGNVRQLYNALVQAVVMADGDEIQRRDVVASAGAMSSGPSINVLEQTLGDGFNLEEHLKSVQRHYLQRAMEEARGVKVKAARLMGMKNYQTLDAQLDRLEVHWKAEET
jgi:transcriptional regulator with PAS, ATPase and Fis domain